MSQEDEKELKDLVTEFLATNGFLSKIQAELRAGVFLALEEQGSFANHSAFKNNRLKDFVSTQNGLLIINLIREFLEFFNLEFTAMVFDPETHSGDDYKFVGRSKLAEQLDVQNLDENSPLLDTVLHTLKNGNKLFNRETQNGIESKSHDQDQSFLIKLDESGHELSKKGSGHHKNGDIDMGEKQLLDETFVYSTREQELNGKSVDEDRDGLSESPLDEVSENHHSSQPNSVLTVEESDHHRSNSQANSVRTVEPDVPDPHYDDDFASSSSEPKRKSESVESEIEEDIQTHSNHSTNDDVTVDTSVSKASGYADYSEDISA